MPRRSVILTEQQEQLIESLVRSGRYQNESEVLREALCLIEQRETDEAAKLEALRAAVGVGISAMERGEFKEFSTREALIAHLRKVADRAIAGTEEP